MKKWLLLIPLMRKVDVIKFSILTFFKISVICQLSHMG